MSDCESDVTVRIRQLRQYPLTSGLNEYVLLVKIFLTSSFRAKIDERLALNRTGYAGIDLFLVLLAYFCSVGEFAGLRSFCCEVRHRYGKAGSALAAIADRLNWPTQASVSRLFGSVPYDVAQEFADWLLVGAVDDGEVQKHDSVYFRDCLANRWRVFSFDPTVTVMRVRALFSSTLAPEPKRRTGGFAVLGHSGRKRGDAQVSRPTLQDRGTGLFHHISLMAGNADLEGALGSIVAHLEGWSDRVGEALEQCIVVVDGESFGWAQIKVLGRSGLHFVTRFSYYDEIKSPGFLATFNGFEWQKVADSGSGPVRWAIEIGTRRIGDVDTRLVLTRFESRSGTKRGAGVLVGDWQYEMFATQLSPDAWPASELVTLYYGRCGQENHFSLEDRMLRLDHVFTYNLGGQLLATAVGLWLWNLRIIQGARQVGGLEALKVALEPREVVTRTFEDAPPHQGVPKPPVAASTDMSCLKADSGQAASKVVKDPLDGIDGWVRAGLMDFDWYAKRFQSLPGWTTNEATNLPICTAGHVLQILQPRVQGTKVELRFQVLTEHCTGCEHRPGCTPSEAPNFAKEVTIRLPPPPGQDLSSLAGRRRASKPRSPSVYQYQRKLSPTTLADSIAAPGPHGVNAAGLVAPELIRQSRQAMRRTVIWIHVKTGSLKPKSPAYFAATPDKRQARRQLWSKRIAWNALPAGSQVAMDVELAPGAQIAGLIDCGVSC